MGTAAAGLIGMIGLALVVTAFTLPGRQSPAVINAFGNSTAKVELASLGVK